MDVSSYRVHRGFWEIGKEQGGLVIHRIVSLKNAPLVLLLKLQYIVLFLLCVRLSTKQEILFLLLAP